VELVTTDLAAALAGAELAILSLPTSAHADLAARLAPRLAPLPDGRPLLMAAPGHTLLLLPHTLRRHGVERPLHCETGTLPFICRMDGPGRVRITQPARYLAFAVFPARDAPAVVERIRPLFPAIRPLGSILETVFPYTNAIHHPPATLCNAGRIEATGGDYYHYFDGVTPSVGRLIDCLDRERVALGRAFGLAVVPFVEQFHRMGYTTRAAGESGSAYQAFHQSEPDRTIRAPASLDDRFIREDVPFGLVLLSELGRMAAVGTPTIDHLVQLASVATGRDFRAAGLTLAGMGLADCTPEALLHLLQHGYPA
jgi:opine dehydrogenase